MSRPTPPPFPGKIDHHHIDNHLHTTTKILRIQKISESISKKSLIGYIKTSCFHGHKAPCLASVQRFFGRQGSYEYFFTHVCAIYLNDVYCKSKTI